MALGAHDVKPPGGHDLLVLGVGDSPGLRQRRLTRLGRSGGRIEALLPEQLLGKEVGIAAEENVGASSRHVRRDRHRGLTSGLGHDLRLALVILGVEDLVLDAASLEQR